MMRAILTGLLVAFAMVSAAAAADLTAVVKKPSVDVYAEPRLDAPKVSTLKSDATVTISAQQGLWYALRLSAGGTGYVRVNDVRLVQAATASSGANVQSLTAGQAGAGRVTETAGVRGIDESDLKTAEFNQAELDKMTAYRVADDAAAAHAAAQGWESTKVAYSAEAKPAKKSGASGGGGSGSGGGALSAAKSMFGSISSGISSALGTAEKAEKAMPKSEAEQSAEELALGPQIAGRALGARPLWSDDTAQQRVNVIGRWVASQTSRPDLPWSFGIIDTPEINAFAAPGGYILVTRGLYEILASDGEVAAVLGHEISHCVQRDHYNVIRKQELAAAGKDVGMGEVRKETQALQTQTPVADAALNYALQYVEEHGATILLTSLDRAAEYRADEAAEIYVARAGMNPLALYAVLQKMASLGSQSPALAQLYKTHPSLDDRMDRIDKRDNKALKPYTLRE
jgi:Zn-dependent protease with chaperone function